MAFKPGQKDELDSLGVENVRLKLAYAGPGKGAAVIGFTTGDMDRGDIEAWLAEQERKASKLQADTLWWAKWSALIGVAGIIVTVIIAMKGR